MMLYKAVMFNNRVVIFGPLESVDKAMNIICADLHPVHEVVGDKKEIKKIVNSNFKNPPDEF